MDRFSPIVSLSLKSYALALMVVVLEVFEDFLDMERSKVAPEFEVVKEAADFAADDIDKVEPLADVADVLDEFSIDTLTDDDDIDEEETEIDEDLLVVIIVVLLLFLRLRSLAFDVEF